MGRREHRVALTPHPAGGVQQGGIQQGGIQQGGIQQGGIQQGGVQQGGVAGGVPPHKGGPQARPSKWIQESDFPTLPEDEAWTGHDLAATRGIGICTRILDCTPPGAPSQKEKGAPERSVCAYGIARKSSRTHKQPPSRRPPRRRQARPRPLRRRRSRRTARRPKYGRRCPPFRPGFPAPAGPPPDVGSLV